MTKTVIYKCDICKIDGREESAVIGIQTNRSNNKKYTAAPEQCHKHVCQSCAQTIYKKVKENKAVDSLKRRYYQTGIKEREPR